MKISIYTLALFLIIGGLSSLYAQSNERLPVKDNITDTARIKLQIALNPSFQNLANKNLHLSINSLFSYKGNRIKRYLDKFNRAMAQFLLVKISNGLDPNDFYVDDSPFFDHRNAFQYNFLKSRQQFKFKSDIFKATW